MEWGGVKKSFPLQMLHKGIYMCLKDILIYLKKFECYIPREFGNNINLQKKTHLNETPVCPISCEHGEFIIHSASCMSWCDIN